MTDRSRVIGHFVGGDDYGVTVHKSDEFVGARLASDVRGRPDFVDLQFLAAEEIVEIQLTREQAQALRSALDLCAAEEETPLAQRP